MSMWIKKAQGKGAKRFGLVKSQGSGGPPRSAAVAAAFGGGEESAEPADERAAMNARLRDMEAARKRKAAAAPAVADASVYDYDGQYDAMKAEELARMSARVGVNCSGDGGRKKARYIGALQSAAKVREREFDRVYERQLLKEQEAETAQFGETERFVTAAYKKQLQESRKWDMEDAAATEREEKTSATSAGMHGFYSNLLTKNIGMGADVAGAAVSSYTHGSKRNAKMEAFAKPEPPPPAAAADGDGGDDDDASAAAARALVDGPDGPDAAAAAPAAPADDAAARARAAFCASRGYDAVAARLADDGGDDAPAAPPPPKRETYVSATAADPKGAALSARERFLARKRAKEAG